MDELFQILNSYHHHHLIIDPLLCILQLTYVYNTSSRPHAYCRFYTLWSYILL